MTVSDQTSVRDFFEAHANQVDREERAKRDAKIRNASRNTRRRERDQAMRDLGMVRVRGALGGVYWE